MKVAAEVAGISTSSAPADGLDVPAGHRQQKRSEGRRVEARRRGGVRSAPAWVSPGGPASNTPRPLAGAPAVASSGTGARDPQKERP
jgi:hypothetical protein